MSPDPRRYGAAGVASRRDKPRRRSALEKEVLERVKGLDGFWKALRNFSKVSGLPEEDLEGFADELASCCWSEAQEVAGGEGPLAAAREEVDRLKQKLHQCNLSAVKQIAACKAGTHFNGAYGDETITFHEPLQYLDQETKDLVMTVVCEKVRQLEDGVAPPALVEALVQHVAAPAQGGGGGPADEELAEELETAKLELRDARAELSKARIRAEDAEDRAEELKRQQEVLRREAEALKRSLVEAERLADGLRAELKGAQEALVRAEEKTKEAEAKAAEAEARAAEALRALEDLKRDYAKLRSEHEALQEVSAQQQAEIERLHAEIERVGEELEKERRANGALRAEVERQQGLVKRAQEELKELQGRFNELEEEANKMREELARRNRTSTHGTQTTLTGTKLDDQAAEMKKLKLMLEELQMKFKEMIEKCKRKGMGKEISQIAEDLGLQDVLKEQTVFQRLYDDAMHRVHRLERLREKIRKERKELCPSSGTPRSAALGGELSEPSVIDSIGQSDLPGLHSLMGESDAGQGTPSTRTSPTVQEQEREGEQPPRAGLLLPPTWLPRAGRQDRGAGEACAGDRVRAQDGSASPQPRSIRAALMQDAGTAPQQPRSLRAVTSLPALPTTTTSASVVTLGYGSHALRPGRSRRTLF